MQYGEIPGVTKPVARLTQGTVMIGSDKIDYSFNLLDEVLALGGNTFDTAHGYGNGDCERTLGRWIETRGVRDRVVIITKGAHHNQDRARVTPFDITSRPVRLAGAAPHRLYRPLSAPPRRSKCPRRPDR